MRIVMVLPHLQIGGAEKQTIELAKGLNSRGAEIALFAFRKHGKLTGEIPSGIEVVFPAFSPVSPLKTPIKVFSLAMFLRKFRPQLIYTQWEHSPVAIAGRMLGIPTVVVYVTDMERRMISLNAKRKRISALMRLRLSAKLATQIVANSHGLAEECRKYLRLESKPTVIYNGVNLENIRKKSIQFSGCHPWVHDGTVPLAVSVARLVKEKGFESLIDAYAILNKRMKARLLIVGDGEMKNILLAKIRELKLQDSVSLVGWKVNPYPYIASARLYVSSSVREGLSNSILEAVALGVPVVSTNHRFGADEIIDDGGNGFLVPVGDAQALADAIEKILKNKALADAMSRRAKDTTGEFTVERMVAEHELLFEEVVNGKSR